MTKSILLRLFCIFLHLTTYLILTINQVFDKSDEILFLTNVLATLTSNTSRRVSGCSNSSLLNGRSSPYNSEMYDPNLFLLLGIVEFGSVSSTSRISSIWAAFEDHPPSITNVICWFFFCGTQFETNPTPDTNVMWSVFLVSYFLNSSVCWMQKFRPIKRINRYETPVLIDLSFPELSINSLYI